MVDVKGVATSELMSGFGWARGIEFGENKGEMSGRRRGMDGRGHGGALGGRSPFALAKETSRRTLIFITPSGSTVNPSPYLPRKNFILLYSHRQHVCACVLVQSAGFSIGLFSRGHLSELHMINNILNSLRETGKIADINETSGDR